MILTVTLNPAVDISYRLNELMVNEVNRCNSVIKTAGGKGLNVTRVISQVGEDVCATGLLGGANGSFIIDKLVEASIANDFVRINGETRNCIAVLHDWYQTEILEAGPNISYDEKQAFLKKYEDLVDKAEIIVASGSIPKDLGNDFYGTLVDIANKHNKKMIVDTSGEALTKSLSAKPYLIKPNKEELSQLFDKAIEDENTLITVLAEMNVYDIPCIIVSLGEEGAMALVNKKMYKVTPPKVKAVNPVGSGDATVAGFAIALKNNYTTEELLRYGCVLGTLNALEQQTGYVNVDLLEEYMNKTKVTCIKEIE